MERQCLEMTPGESPLQWHDHEEQLGRPKCRIAKTVSLPRPHQSLHIPSAACQPSRSTPPAPAAARGSPRTTSPPSAAPAPRWQRRRASAAGLVVSVSASVAGQQWGLAVGARHLGGEGWRQRWPARTWDCAVGLAAAGRAAGIVGCGEAHTGEALEPHALEMSAGAFA